MRIEITEQEKEELLKIKPLIYSSHDSYKLAQSLLKQMFGKRLKKILFRVPTKLRYSDTWFTQFYTSRYILTYYNPPLFLRFIDALIKERNIFYKG